MDYSEARNNAKALCGKCYVCDNCNGIACKGQIPGMGGKGSGRSFIRNFDMLTHVKLNMDVLCDNKPIDTSFDFLGYHMALPVFIAPMAGIKGNFGADMSEYEYNNIIAKGADECNIMAFCGDGKDVDNLFVEPFKAMASVNDRAIVTIKPWVKEGIDLRIDKIKDYDYAFVAMDVDAAGLPLLRNSSIPTENKNVESLKYIKDKCQKPFIVKGIMTVAAAKKAIEASCDAIVVSNHGGRVCDDTLSTIEVLPEIAKVCKGKIKVLVDGGIRTGYDIFKCLALGADGVFIGRPFGIAAIGGNKEGIKAYCDKLQTELKDACVMCGAHNLQEINESMVTFVK